MFTGLLIFMGGSRKALLRRELQAIWFRTLINVPDFITFRSHFHIWAFPRIANVL